MPGNNHPTCGLDRILTKKDLRTYVPFTSQHIARLERDGLFPKRLQIGPNRVGWLEREIKEWMDEKAADRSKRPNGKGIANPGGAVAERPLPGTESP